MSLGAAIRAAIPAALPFELEIVVGFTGPPCIDCRRSMLCGGAFENSGMIVRTVFASKKKASRDNDVDSVCALETARDPE
jgi:hypothetical protein